MQWLKDRTIHNGTFSLFFVIAACYASLSNGLEPQSSLIKRDRLYLSMRMGAPVAPGSLMSILGSKLTVELRKAEEWPLATEMAGTGGLIAGRSPPQWSLPPRNRPSSPRT